MSDDSRPLPYGWISQTDPNTSHPFYVDTKATPPRSIWVHPYEDEQYLKEHPDVKEKVGKDSRSDKPPDYLEVPSDSNPRRHSYGGPSSRREDLDIPDRPESTTKGKRGLFGKLKDKAIGTKEEREAAKKEAALQRQRRQEERIRLMQLQQQAYAQQQAQLAQGNYGGAPSPYGYGNPYAQQMGGGRRTGGFGGGGLALPLIGGLAGGLLLGEAFDGADYGGDYGGGFGGGDFGGGDFGGF